MILLATPVAIASGFLLSIGDKFLDLMLFGLVGGCFILFLPLSFLMYALIISTLLIAGTAEYFGQISQAQWIPFLMTLALYARLPMEMLRSGRPVGGRTGQKAYPTLYWLIAVYLVLIVSTAFVNQAPIIQTLVGAKSYIFFWSVLFVVLVADTTPGQLDAFWKIVVFVALIQLPFVLIQHFVIMKARGGWAPFDSITGTFGGDPNRGGPNATLLLYMIVAAVYTTALYREGLLKRRWWLTTLALSAVVIALGETKIAMILIPSAFTIVYWDHLKKNPGALFAFGGAMVVAVGTLVAVYQYAYWEDSLRSGGVVESFEKSLSYMADPYNMTRETGEVGRVAALNLWWEDPKADGIRRAIGYGPGASRAISSISIGEVAKRYTPYAINANAAATLLWDVGVIGLVCFSIILVNGALLAYRVAGQVAPNSPQRAGLRTATAVLVCMLVMIPYNRTVIDEAAVLLLEMFCFAYTLYWYRALRQEAAKSPQANSPRCIQHGPSSEGRAR